MDIPESVEVDISHLNLGESFRVEDLEEIEKITVKSSPDQILASVTQAMKEEEVVVEEEELEEGEEGATEEGTTEEDSKGKDADSKDDEKKTEDNKEEGK